MQKETQAYMILAAFTVLQLLVIVLCYDFFNTILITARSGLLETGNSVT